MDFALASRQEWLETNGTGTFAMGTASGALTRRYHGYLVGGLDGRQVWLSKVDEEMNGVALGANQFPGVVHPDGFQWLVSFQAEPYPCWTYTAGAATLRKSLYLVPGRDAAVIEYAADADGLLVARPFLAGRDYHALRREGAIPGGLLSARRWRRLAAGRRMVA